VRLSTLIFARVLIRIENVLNAYWAISLKTMVAYAKELSIKIIAVPLLTIADQKTSNT